MLVVLADLERSVEILRHRADVADAVLGFVAPAADRQRRHLVEHRRVVERNDVRLDVAVAQRRPRSRTGSELRADGAGGIGVEREPTRRARQELVRLRRGEDRVAVGAIAPHERALVRRTRARTGREAVRSGGRVDVAAGDRRERAGRGAIEAAVNNCPFAGRGIIAAGGDVRALP